jgi:maltose/moltooligosaccharide transporter
MEPFRAFVGDNLPKKQRTLGFAMQSFFIGTGAIVASALPWMLANWFGVDNTAAAGHIPDTVKWSFYLGGIVFLAAVAWTVFSSREYSPEEIAAFEAGDEAVEGLAEPAERPAAKYRSGGFAWIVAGGLLLAWIVAGGLDKQLYILAIGAIAFGVLQLVVAALQTAGRTANGVYRIVEDLFHMPRVMKQLAVVQFFSWFALFAMWIYSTAAVTSHHFGTADVTSAAYNDGANWVGVLFAAYNGFAALAAFAIPVLARRLGARHAHLLHLVLGGIGLISFWFIRDPAWLIVPMIGVGIAWASILSLPYALLSDVLPSAKMGIYMGIFNFFIVIPQLIAASVLGLLLREFFGGAGIFGLVIGGVLMIVAGFATLLVDREAEPERT